MIPRPYQSELVKRAVNALREHSNTLAVAPTGAGKTLMISWLLKELGGRQMILQHREELVGQNQNKFHLINPTRTSSIYGLGIKDLSGETIFGMSQTLGRNGEMNKIPALDVLVIDEAHHARADSYIRITEAAREKNPDCLIAGFTATASRGDKRGLKPTFDNVCDVVSIGKLTTLGHLVPTKTYIATLPGLAEEIQNVRKTSSGEYDLDEVETLMDTVPVNSAVLREWKSIAGDRKTIIFCSTIRHAQSVCSMFKDSGINAECVFGDTTGREEILRQFEHGNIQVVCNVAVLTEGYDCPICSCIVLLRPCSFHSTMIQMIGRGLRPFDNKRDCIILDFGESCRVHGSLEAGVRLEDAELGEAETKDCPQCHTSIPARCSECPACGYEFQVFTGDGKEKQEADIVMLEMNLMKQSPFMWSDIFHTGKCLVASGFNAWASVASPDGETWIGIGKTKGRQAVKIAVGDKIQVLAQADDFMRRHEDSDAAKKGKRWLKDLPSVKQLELLKNIGAGEFAYDMNLKKYEANCLLNFMWNRDFINYEVMRYAN